MKGCKCEAIHSSIGCILYPLKIAHPLAPWHTKAMHMHDTVFVCWWSVWWERPESASHRRISPLSWPVGEAQWCHSGIKEMYEYKSSLKLMKSRIFLNAWSCVEPKEKSLNRTCYKDSPTLIIRHGGDFALSFLAAQNTNTSQVIWVPKANLFWYLEGIFRFRCSLFCPILCSKYHRAVEGGREHSKVAVALNRPRAPGASISVTKCK